MLLAHRCLPVYTKYQFGSCPAHKSKPHPHSHSILFNDFHVILLGTFDPSLLAELLRGPPLLVELHDRDRRVQRNSNLALFGQESKDALLGTHAFGTDYVGKYTRVWDPYGVTQVDLSGLLLGQRLIEVKCPVTGGPRSHAYSSSHSPFTMETTDGGLMSCSPSSPLPPGDYLGSHCELSVVVELTNPLQLSMSSTSAPVLASPVPSPQTTPTRSSSKSTPTRAATRATSTLSKQSPRASSKIKKKKEREVEGSGSACKSSCPFNRLVYVISAEGKSLVQQLLMKVYEINARALGFEKLSDKMKFAALSTYKLTR